MEHTHVDPRARRRTPFVSRIIPPGYTVTFNKVDDPKACHVNYACWFFLRRQVVRIRIMAASDKRTSSDTSHLSGNICQPPKNNGVSWHSVNGSDCGSRLRSCAEYSLDPYRVHFLDGIGSSHRMGSRGTGGQGSSSSFPSSPQSGLVLRRVGGSSRGLCRLSSGDRLLLLHRSAVCLSSSQRVRMRSCQEGAGRRKG